VTMLSDVTTELVYTLGTVGMAVGVVVAVLGLASSRRAVVAGGTGRLVYGLLLWTCGVAALSYAGMALGVGSFVAAGGYVETLRYVDWALTTPVLVGVVGLLAGATRPTIAAAVVADVVMIAVGYAASVASGPAKWAGFLVSSAFFLGLAYYLFGPFGRTAASQSFRRRALFEKVRNLTGVLWFVYPAVWVLGPSGVDLMDVTTTAAVVTYLDVTAKTGYTLIVANSQGAFAPLFGDATGDETPPAADGTSAD